VILAGCLLRWWTVGGANGLPELSGNAFDGMGILVFVIALATIALVTLPYAAERPVAADRWPAFALLAVLGSLGFVIRIVDLIGLHAFLFASPADVVTHGPGLWVVGIGLVMLGRAAYDIYREPERG
jgi:hypothetical protein